MMEVNQQAHKLRDLISRSRGSNPIRVAVVNAAQGVVLETLSEATELGIIEPTLIGDTNAIRELSVSAGIRNTTKRIINVKGDAAAAAAGVSLIRDGNADVLMKGLIHTDVFLRAILDSEHGLRLAGRRVSHAFLCDIPSYSKFLVITDAAINITPNLNAKAQILQNAIELCQLLGVDTPKAAVLSAVETVNPEIPSTLDAAALTMMALRDQIHGAIVDGPLAFDNAISRIAATEKSIASKVAGQSDILLVPDLVSGNILAKTLEYLAGAVAAGVVLGLSAPVILSSRSDPSSSRLAALALAALIHSRTQKAKSPVSPIVEKSLQAAPQSESACCPLPE